MADTKREIERKYEAAAGDELPDLTGVAGVSAVIDRGLADLDATYYDTPDQRLAASLITLRRRTGGDDAGWHLKLPVADDVRDEVHAPLSDTVPPYLSGLVRSRVRDAELVPVVRLRSARDIRHLVDADGTLLAEVSLDRVRAERLSGGTGTAEWTEIEVELADDGDPAFLDKVDRKLRKAGVSRSSARSKLARALEETGKRRKPAAARKEKAAARNGKANDKGKANANPKANANDKAKEKAPVTAGDHVLAYVRAQREAVVELDPAVRRDVFDSVHAMRVATRRLRSTFRSYGKVLDRGVTDPIADELKWLAGELGVDRDQEVLTERLTTAVSELPRPLVSGPVQGRLRTWSNARRGGSRRGLIAVLDGKRYLDLLVALDAVVADPPLLEAAAGDPSKVIAGAVRKDFRKVAELVGRALDLPPGQDRDVAIHEARKKAKRTRYAAEAAAPALGKPAEALVKSMKSLQTLLGEHQDSVMARIALRELSDQAHAAGENTFTYGVLYGREEQRAAAAEAALPALWRAVEGETEV
ncbi:CYTH and CHAD domain-containing protein [Streptomyces yaanensis]|uniref:CYTH and CHAD domain-containing protein n=1 Tax=Streptomyces yaanensis TaxID=1142239 RepID=A0ABV7SKV5_9ACTN|nr:CYTH and CHAD domain-containing protein [Streptomyces sp. CGMCC 4.7035]WNC01846.1 CYTH and CHAD domain-containing protein [Streptomyces sp. CGMCC 4.7035]